MIMAFLPTSKNQEVLDEGNIFFFESFLNFGNSRHTRYVYNTSSLGKLRTCRVYPIYCLYILYAIFIFRENIFFFIFFCINFDLTIRQKGIIRFGAVVWNILAYTFQGLIPIYIDYGNNE